MAVFRLPRNELWPELPVSSSARVANQRYVARTRRLADSVVKFGKPITGASSSIAVFVTRDRGFCDLLAGASKISHETETCRDLR